VIDSSAKSAEATASEVCNAYDARRMQTDYSCISSGLVDATGDDDSDTRKAKLYSDSDSGGGAMVVGGGEDTQNRGNLE
jgi:hypothetical protein